MTGEESAKEDPQLRELIREIPGMMIEEWNDRTAFGKLLYPGWVLYSTVLWVLFITIYLGALYVEVMSQPIGIASAFKRLTPEVYKRE